MPAILIAKPCVQSSMDDENASSRHHPQASGHNTLVIHQLHDPRNWLLHVNSFKHTAHVFQTVISALQLGSQKRGSHIQIMAAEDVHHHCQVRGLWTQNAMLSIISHTATAQLALQAPDTAGHLRQITGHHRFEY